MDNKEFDYKRAAEQLCKGEPLFSKDDALAPMLERILNAALEGEMDAHLTSEERSQGNRRNGKMPKQVQTCYGAVIVETPRDRDGSFEPQTVKKCETILAEGMADQIINMYAFGTSTRDISKHFEREFDTRLSAETVSSITDRVLPEIKSWRSRMLDPVYAICWLDAIHYKVKDETGRAVSRAIYNVLGINKEGHKELLGMYVSKSEGANFWLEVLSDLQNRGVRNILICCIDGLRGASLILYRAYSPIQVSNSVLSIKYAALSNTLAASIKRSFSGTLRLYTVPLAKRLQKHSWTHSTASGEKRIPSS